MFRNTRKNTSRKVSYGNAFCVETTKENQFVLDSIKLKKALIQALPLYLEIKWGVFPLKFQSQHEAQYGHVM